MPNRVMMQVLNVAAEYSHRFLYLQHNGKVFASGFEITRQQFL
jgi:ABC-type hemin transport system ATPase subunit